MEKLGFVWVLLACAVVVLAASIPYWRVPYDELVFLNDQVVEIDGRLQPR